MFVYTSRLMINDDAGSIIAARLFLFLINDPTISCNYYSRHSCNARLKRTDSNSINRNRKSGGEGRIEKYRLDRYIYLFVYRRVGSQVWCRGNVLARVRVPVEVVQVFNASLCPVFRKEVNARLGCPVSGVMGLPLRLTR